jgi:hypothetical protein
MESVFKKLNLKHQTEILVLNAPKSFESELLNLANVVIHDNAETMDAIDFALVFVITRASFKMFVCSMNATMILSQ